MLSIFLLSRNDIDLTGRTRNELQSWPSKFLTYSPLCCSLSMLGLHSSDDGGKRRLILFSALAIAVIAANFLRRVYLRKALCMVRAALRALTPPYLRSSTSICLSSMSCDNSYLKLKIADVTVQFNALHRLVRAAAVQIHVFILVFQSN